MRAAKRSSAPLNTSPISTALSVFYCGPPALATLASVRAASRSSASRNTSPISLRARRQGGGRSLGAGGDPLVGAFEDYGRVR